MRWRAKIRKPTEIQSMTVKEVIDELLLDHVYIGVFLLGLVGLGIEVISVFSRSPLDSLTAIRTAAGFSLPILAGCYWLVIILRQNKLLKTRLASFIEPTTQNEAEGQTTP